MKIYIGLETIEPGAHDNYWKFVTAVTRNLPEDCLTGIKEALRNDDEHACLMFATRPGPEDPDEYVDHLANVAAEHNVIQSGIAWMVNVDIVCATLGLGLDDLFGSEYAWAWPDRFAPRLLLAYYEN